MVRLLRGRAGPVVRQVSVGRDILEATYFDTADRRLADAGITPRRRSGGSDAGWHLKLPAAGGHREEVHAPVGAATSTVPSVLEDRVHTISLGEPLVPVARIDTTRSTFELLDHEGRVLATLDDDRVRGEIPQRRVVSQWRELEIELAQATDETLLESSRPRCAPWG